MDSVLISLTPGKIFPLRGKVHIQICVGPATNGGRDLSFSLEVPQEVVSFVTTATDRTWDKLCYV